MRILLTAGFDRARNVLALGELLRRDGQEVCGVLVVNPFNLRRLRALIRQRGKKALLEAARKLLGRRGKDDGQGPVEEFLRRNDLRDRTLKSWCAAHGIPRRVTPDLNSPGAVEFSSSVMPDVIAYGGGGILRDRFLSCARHGVLNAHSGPLPEIRGMNACEWSLLLGLPPTVTIHFIDAGIDTGAVVESILIEVEKGDDVERLREKCVVAGVEGLRRAIAGFRQLVPKRFPEATAHRQCFILAPVLRELLDWKLAAQTASPKERAG